MSNHPIASLAFAPRTRWRGLVLPLLVMLLALAAPVVTGPPASAELPYNASEFTVSATVGPPGITLTVTGLCTNGGQPTESARIRGFDRDFTRDWTVLYPVAKDGTFGGNLYIPANASPGPLQLRLSCGYYGTFFAESDPKTFTVTTAPPIIPPTTTTAPPTTTTPPTTTSPMPSSTTTTTTAPRSAEVATPSPAATAMTGTAHLTG